MQIIIQPQYKNDPLTAPHAPAQSSYFETTINLKEKTLTSVQHFIKRFVPIA